MQRPELAARQAQWARYRAWDESHTRENALPRGEAALLTIARVLETSAVLRLLPDDPAAFVRETRRPRDREDVAGIIRTQGVGLDRSYLDPLIEGLAADMGRPDLLDFYRGCVGEGR